MRSSLARLAAVKLANSWKRRWRLGGSRGFGRPGSDLGDECGQHIRQFVIRHQPRNLDENSPVIKEDFSTYWGHPEHIPLEKTQCKKSAGATHIRRSVNPSPLLACLTHATWQQMGRLLGNNLMLVRLCGSSLAHTLRFEIGSVVAFFLARSSTRGSTDLLQSTACR
jgi:hypothetical protein